MDLAQKIGRVAAGAFGAIVVLLAAGCGGGSSAPPPAPVPVPVPVTYAVGGTVSGLSQGTVLTLSNGTDTVNASANGSFAFPGKLAAGAAYNVTAANPAGHVCTIKDGAGTVATADVTKVAVQCTALLLAGVESRVQAAGSVAIDAAGNTYLLDTDSQVILKITKAGEVSTLAGTKGVRGSKDGVGTAATFRFDTFAGVALDPQGNLYVTDSCNGLLRKVTPAGVVSTVAGAGFKGCANYPTATPDPVDGTGSAAVLVRPGPIAIAKNGDILINERVSPTVRRVTPAGVVTTETYNFEGGYISAMAVDKAGVLYLAVLSDQWTIRKVQSGSLVIVAGGAAAGQQDGTGVNASFTDITAMAFDSAGELYIADGATLRKMTAAGTVSTLAGGADYGQVNGIGAAARLGLVRGIAIDPAGNVVISESDRATLRVVSTGGAVSTFAATPFVRGYVDGQGAAARFNNASSLAAGPDGTLYIADSIKHVVRKVTPAGVVSLFAGIPDTKGAADGAVASATFNAPRAVAVDQNGIVYVADAAGIRKIADGVVSLLATTGRPVYALAVDPDGNVAASDGNSVTRYTPTGARTVMANRSMAATALNIGDKFMGFIPQGIAYDAARNLYISDTSSMVVYKRTKEGVLSVFAGTPTVEGDADGPPGTATFGFYTLEWMTVDGAGNVYLSGQGKLRKISPAGVVSTPSLAWGNPNLLALAYYKGMLYGTTKYAILQVPVE